MLSELYHGKRDTVPFNCEIKEITRKPGVVLVILSDNSWLSLGSSGWTAKTYDPDIQDVIYENQFYSKDRTSESIGLKHVSYVHRPAKGITYKTYHMRGVEISRHDNDRVYVGQHRYYAYRFNKYKKYSEHHLTTHEGLTLYEKVNNNGRVLQTSIRVEGNNKTTYSMHIKCISKKEIEISMHRNFEREQRMHRFKYRDASIDFVYNKYVTFDFDMLANPEEYEVFDGVRTFFKSNILCTYNRLKDDGKNVTLFSKFVKAIEVMEDDQSQIQKRP
ncbi:hypothetical protein ENKO_080 [Klebsiella phage fENko-Kae01]|nr:hypothetical protein [Klebsiella phage fENko-Kae01]